MLKEGGRKMSSNFMFFILGLFFTTVSSTIEKEIIFDKFAMNKRALKNYEDTTQYSSLVPGIGTRRPVELREACGLTEFLLYGVPIWSSDLVRIQPEWKIYYNLTTHQAIDIIDTNNPRVQYYKSRAAPKILRIGFGPIPCSCENLTCGCCTGINITYFNFDRRACMNFTYDPYQFSLKLNMLMNDDSLYAQTISGKNPPPACLPVPFPSGPPIDFCFKFFNIHTPGYNLFMCLDFETRVTRAPVLILHFDCMQMGVDGIHHHKPEDALTGPDVEEEDAETRPPNSIEVYDEVFEEDAQKNMTTQAPKSPQNKDNE